MEHYSPQWEIYLFFRLVRQPENILNKILELDNIAIDNHFEKDYPAIIRELKRLNEEKFLKLDNIVFNKAYLQHQHMKEAASLVGSSSGYWDGKRDKTYGLGEFF